MFINDELYIDVLLQNMIDNHLVLKTLKLIQSYLEHPVSMKKTMNKVDVLIPCYNEDKNIETLINSWASVAKKNQDLNIYFIDNGSTDSTNKALKGFIENLNLPNLFILEIEINKGYGHGIKFGLSLSHSQIVCWTHADLQIPVEEVVEVIKEYSSINDREKFIFKGKELKEMYLINFLQISCQ